MPIPLIPIAISLATKFAPALIGRLAGDKAQETAEKVVGIAQNLTGREDPEEALSAIQADPELALKYQQSLRDSELGIYREDTKRLETVNETIRAEMSSKDPYNARWRATFGYSVALSWFLMFLTVLVAFLFAFFKKPDTIGDVAGALGELFSATSMLWAVALPILGVAVHKRSQDKKTATGDESGGLAGLIRAIRK